MNSTTSITDRDPAIAACPFCGHPGTHAPVSVTPVGGVRYCSSCAECETELERLATAAYATRPRRLTAAVQ